MRLLNKITDESRYAELAEMLRIANQAVKKAKEDNKKYGIPEFFFKNGKIYYILKNGELTTIPPEILKRKKTA